MIEEKQVRFLYTTDGMWPESINDGDIIFDGLNKCIYTHGETFFANKNLIDSKADMNHTHSVDALIGYEDILSKSDAQANFLKKNEALDLFAEKKEYLTRTEVMNLINEYMRWGDGKMTIYYKTNDPNTEIRLFNRTLLDNVDFLEIDGNSVDKSSLQTLNATLYSVGNNQLANQTIVKYTFPNAGEHKIELKYSSPTLASYTISTLPHITKIELPTIITTIQNDSIGNLESLTSILLSDNITTLGERNIGKCPLLTSISFPNKLTSINNGVLSTCPNIEMIKFGKSVTDIQTWALGDLNKLKTIYFYADNITLHSGSNNENVFWGAGKLVPSSEKFIYYEGNNDTVPSTILNLNWFKGGRYYNENYTPWQIYNKGVRVQ